MAMRIHVIFSFNFIIMLKVILFILSPITVFGALMQKPPAQLKYPQITPFNSTHQVKCDLFSDCDLKRQQLELVLIRNTWWSCQGDCLQQFINDLFSNLQSQDCLGCLITEPLPTYLSQLRNTALQLYNKAITSSPLNCSLDTSRGAIDLLQNVLIQKSRYCRFDLDLYSKYITLISQCVK